MKLSIVKKSNQLVKNSQVYLSNLKKEIEKYPNSWDIYKKYTNTYEYIHSQIPSKKLRYPSVNLSLGHILNLLNLQMFLIY